MDAEQHGGLLLALTLASAGLWYYIIRNLRSGRQPVPYEPRNPPHWNLPVVAFALFLISLSVFSLKGDGNAEVTLEIVQRTCSFSLLVSGLIGALLLLNKESRLADFGIQLARLPEQLRIGAMGFLASLLPVYTVIVLTSHWRTIEKQHPFLTFVQENPGPESVAWVVLTVAILVPIAEELQYRVVFQGWLQSMMPARFAVPVTAFVFSAVHGFPDSIALVPLALVLGYLYARRNSFVAVVVVHALFNGLNLFMALSSSHPASEPVTMLFHR